MYIAEPALLARYSYVETNWTMFSDESNRASDRIINNRPDEEAPDGAKSTDMRAAAAAAGLTYVHAPFVGQPTPEAVEVAAKAVGPTLAYCRSGTRSTTAWALAQAKTGAMSAEDIIEAAAGAGYNISGLKETLRRLGAK